MQNAEHDSSHEEGDEDDPKIREENRILQSLLRRHQWAEDFSRSAAMIRVNRMAIVCRQPAATIRQAQSSTVKLPKRTEPAFHQRHARVTQDRKSTRLNSSHSQISYAVFCLKKKNNLSNR